MHVYALMSTHYHLFVRSLFRNLSKAMQYLESRYVLQFNARHGLDGPLFRDRFKNQIVNDYDYQKYLLAYLHLNPVRANLVLRANESRWTSHRAYTGLDPAPPWLTTSYLLDIFGGATQLDRFVEGVRCGQMCTPEDLDVDGWLRSGVGRTLQVTDQGFVPVHNLPPASETRSRSIEAVLAEVCRLTGSNREELQRSARGRGANPARRFAAWALSRSTRQPLREVAEVLHMSQRQIACLLHRIRSGQVSSEVRTWIAAWCSEKNEI